MHLTRLITLSTLMLAIVSSASSQHLKQDIPTDPRNKATVSLSELPLAFEPNVGQAPANELYMTRSGAMQIGFSENLVSLRSSVEGDGFTILLEGARPDASPMASNKGEGESNYLIGNDAALWTTHIPQYGRITYSEVYPGVDLLFYGKGSRVEHDFVVRPGADYRQIHMRYEGAERLSLSANGDLHAALAHGDVVVHAPAIYQEVAGQREERQGRFVLGKNDEVSFDVGEFDRSLPLVIDPVLDYSTYLAGGPISVFGAAVDAAGNTYIVGQALYAGYPTTPGAFDTTCIKCTASGPLQVTITKLNPAGTAQVYSTLLGGSSGDQAAKIVVDSKGNAIVTGFTASADFPLKNSIPSGPTGVNQFNGFITSLSADGAALNFSSVLGGGVSSPTLAQAVAVDSSQNVYVSGINLGMPQTSYIPQTPGALSVSNPSPFSAHVFLTKFTSLGSVVYGAFLGDLGAGAGCCQALAVDSSGNAYVGVTVGFNETETGTPWPVTAGAFQTIFTGGLDGSPAVMKVSADGSTMVYSTFVGLGTLEDMVLMPDNEVLLAGTGVDIPLSSDAYSSVEGTSFIEKLSTDGSKLPYATFFSTPAGDAGGLITNIALDHAGDVWVAGYTSYVSNIPLVNPLMSVPGNAGVIGGEGFVTEFDPAMHNVLFSTYFGGPSGSAKVSGLALDAMNRAHIAGTANGDVPTTTGAFLNAVTESTSGFTTYGFAALIDTSVAAPAICSSTPNAALTQLGTSSQISFTITSCGNAPLTISNVQSDSAVFPLASQSSCIGSLAPGNSCTVTVNFTPVVAGDASGTITVTSTALQTAYAVTMSGFGSTPSISITPSSTVVFPAQVLGDSSSGFPAVVFAGNQGTAPLIVDPTKASVTGDFSIVGTTCGPPVPPPASQTTGSACTFRIAFTPTALGTSAGTLTIVSNDPVNPTVTVSLSGTAIAAYTTPTITALQAPAVPVGSSGVNLTVSGTNFFPNSSVVIGGEVHTPTSTSTTALTVAVDPSLLTVMGELPVSVVSPAPGGASNVLNLLVYKSIPISTSSLVYNPATQMLYAAIPSSATTNANTVVPIDPLSGNVGTPIAVGKNPNKLALSSDNAYLFVATGVDHTLQRINLSTSQVERTFPLPLDAALSMPTMVIDMHGVPGSPQSVVLSLSGNSSPTDAGEVLYNDAGQVSFLAPTLQNKFDAVASFAFASNPSVIYGYPFAGNFFSEYGVSASGLSIISGALAGTCCNQTTGNMVASDGTLLYTNSGQVWNPATKALVGTYSPSTSLYYEPGVLPDMADGRTYFLDFATGYLGSSGYTDILSFNQATLQQADTVSVPLSASYTTVRDLYRWGSDGFAFRAYTGTPADEIVLIRSSLAHTTPGGTPALTSVAPNSEAVGTTTTQITVSGNEFVPGATVLWNGAPLGTAYVSATQVTALVPGTDFATAGSFPITVVNPSGSSSSGASFIVLGPKLGLSGTTINFGPQQIGVNSAAMQLTVTNTGTASVTGLALSLIGTDLASFHQTSNCGVSLAPTVSCVISVTFAPTTLGSKSATLMLTDNAPDSPQNVVLSGTGADSSFSLAGPSVPTQTGTRGGTALFTIHVTPMGTTFGSAVTFGVTGLPAGAGATFSPVSLAAGTGATDVAMTVTIPTNLARIEQTRVGRELAPFTLAFLLMPIVWRKRRMSKKLSGGLTLLLVLCVSAGLVGLVGCSSGSAPSNSSTSGPETFTLTVTATSGGIAHATTLTLNVQ